MNSHLNKFTTHFFRLIGFHSIASLPSGELPYVRDGDARRKIRLRPLKETNLGVAQALFNPPKGDHTKTDNEIGGIRFLCGADRQYDPTVFVCLFVCFVCCLFILT